jgi:uncharacterized membrane protein (DUF106 family)
MPPRQQGILPSAYLRPVLWLLFYLVYRLLRRLLMGPSSRSILSKSQKGPVLTLVTVIAASTGAVIYSHYSQKRDQAVMKAGVERDKERLREMRRLKKQQEREKLE